MERSVTTTYLQMTDPSQAVAFRGERALELQRVEIACPELNRFLYSAVGSDWWWYQRLDWSRDRWLAYLDRPELETWVGYLSGAPAGYFEMEVQSDEKIGDQVEIAYFGMLPTFIGRGLGAEMLSAAVERSWALQPRRVWVHTCSLDHPNALRNYRNRGFEIYKSEEEIENLPDANPEFWPTT